jgi:hypothetical protein
MIFISKRGAGLWIIREAKKKGVDPLKGKIFPVIRKGQLIGYSARL